MQYAVIFLIVAVGIVSFFYPKIKNIVLSSTNRGSKADYQKLKKDIESAIDSDDEALARYDELYTTFIAYNKLLRNNDQAELIGELPLKGTLFDVTDLMPVNTFGSIQFPISEKTRRRRRTEREQNMRTYPIFMEASKLHLNAGFCLMPMSYVPLCEETSLTVLYGLAKESLLESGTFAVKRGDKLILDTIFDHFTFIVTDIGAIEENDTEYMKAKDGATELMLLFFTPNQTKRFCVYATLEQE